MSPVSRKAPAKLNLTLEVLGRRTDGYHEIRSVVTTLSLADTVTAESGCALLVTADEEYDSAGMPEPGEVNTVEQAMALVRAEIARRRGDPPLTYEAALTAGLAEVAVRLHKRIPAAAGLGGGSSDGASALVVLNEFWAAGLDATTLHRLARQIGSDCPLFLGTAVQSVRGRGELLEALPSHKRAWFCVVRPPIVQSRKTALLYSLVGSAGYGNGARSAALSQRLRHNPGARLVPSDLYNIFDAVADRAFGSLESVQAALRSAGASAVHMCGAGPSVYGLFGGKAGADRAREALAAEGYSAWSVFAPASSTEPSP